MCGLLFYKPQLGAVVAVVLCISQGWRAAVGVLVTGGILLFITVHTMPGTLHQFLFDMPKNLAHMQQSHDDYIWERHVTFRTFWRILVQGWHSGPDKIGVLIGWGICEVVLLAGWRGGGEDADAAANGLADGSVDIGVDRGDAAADAVLF